MTDRSEDNSSSRRGGKIVPSIDPRDDLILAKKNFKLYVGNLRYNLSEEDIRQVFAPYGKVVSVIIPLQRSGVRPGFAYILMAKESEGRAAIEALNGLEFRGRQLKVEEFKEASERPPRRDDYRQSNGQFDGQPRLEDDRNLDH
ncbi:hypothetical protein TVAG_178640 [Trichomonas vaginalis G3]|uniref:RRM domain-containing protein n=1 Tax=Trichomonas vaginalis (strain ATCC PRA-98 / G3) TaxID=412133 RepID=A2DIL6_TRIV3|nr:pre-mRNA cleavage required for polyadenylation [Trichomonas vaginalis G3]EAY19820.1 hypothetical protein TVAG_178640 [Trichomonas vaginalis G3]KAI5524023.1 pre-mRNA cleavage required for polyadenylation [Trichomonas vaginalis G3]|eukprot:XP_001580806.1 hypothetical protein [Trichomonas vaginalis G3]